MLENFIPYIILIFVIAIPITLIVTSRSRLKDKYNNYSLIENKANLTGREFAFISKEKLGLKGLKFGISKIVLSDAYAPKENMLILSERVSDTNSIASLAIVAHELGHAMQRKNKYPLLPLEKVFKVLCKLTNFFITPLLLVGIILFAFNINLSVGSTLCFVALGLFLFHIICIILIIPIEYNASNFAIKYLKNNNFIEQSEVSMVKSLLRTADATYIASFFENFFIIKKKKIRSYK